MPDTINYDATKKRLLIGQGYIDNVEPAVWSYEVSGQQVLRPWFSYRKANRDRPIIGDRRPPSPPGNVQPDHWLGEYTTELLNVLTFPPTSNPPKPPCSKESAPAPPLPPRLYVLPAPWNCPPISPSLSRHQTNQTFSVLDVNQIPAVPSPLDSHSGIAVLPRSHAAHD